MTSPIDPKKGASSYPQGAYSDTSAFMEKLRTRATSPKRFDSSVIGLANPTSKKTASVAASHFGVSKRP
jgi:hypothetical protein